MPILLTPRQPSNQPAFDDAHPGPLAFSSTIPRQKLAQPVGDRSIPASSDQAA
jgi:hypothetical protein